MQYCFQIVHTVVLYYFNAHMNISGGSDNDILHRESALFTDTRELYMGIITIFSRYQPTP